MKLHLFIVPYFLCTVSASCQTARVFNCQVEDPSFIREIDEFAALFENSIDSAMYSEILISLDAGKFDSGQSPILSRPILKLEEPRYLTKIGECLEKTYGYTLSQRIVSLDSSLRWSEYSPDIMRQLMLIHLYDKLVDFYSVPAE